MRALNSHALDRIARVARAVVPALALERVWGPYREVGLARYHRHPQNPADRVERCIRGYVIGIGWWRVYITVRAIAVRSVRMQDRRLETSYRCGWQLWKRDVVRSPFYWRIAVDPVGSFFARFYAPARKPSARHAPRRRKKEVVDE
jgi:hypothetical protein